MSEDFMQPTDVLRESLIEREAAKITDPLERLRYLRRQGPKPVAPPQTLPEVLSIEVVAAKPARWPFWAAATFALTAGIGFWGYQSIGKAAPKLVVKTSVPTPSPGALPAEVWQVDTSNTEEVYSNGLRIDLSFVTKNRPRE
ncbi:MAG: hypothetical protein ABI995_03180, partial [Acidobacteriota bacterium]